VLESCNDDGQCRRDVGGVALLGTTAMARATLMEMIMGYRAAERGPYRAEIDGVQHDLVGLSTRGDRRSRYSARAGRPVACSRA